MSNKSEVKYEFKYFEQGWGQNIFYVPNFYTVLLLKILYNAYFQEDMLLGKNKKLFMWRGETTKNLMPLHLKNYIFERLYS